MPDSEDRDEIKTVMNSRRGKLSVCTRHINELRPLLVEDGDVKQVEERTSALHESIEAFKASHVGVQALLLEEETQNDSEWFEQKMQEIEDFLATVETWKEEHQLLSILKPSDSISQVSRTSRTSAAKRALAEKAAAEARSKSLQALHAQMEMEEREHAIKCMQEELTMKHRREQEEMAMKYQRDIEDMALKSKQQMEAQALKLKRQNMEMKVQLDAAHAQIHSLIADEPEQDAMSEYVNASKEQSEERLAEAELVEPTLPDVSALEFAPLVAVPKTPLQRAVRHIHTSSRGTAPSTINQQRPVSQVDATSPTGAEQPSSPMDLVEVLVRQQNLSLLPQRQVPVFNGDPLSYQTFMHAFKYLIEEKTSNSQDRLYFLEQFTAGQAKHLVRSCMYKNPSQGYKEAKELLQKHFGNEMKIANAYMEKALNWATIKPDDGKSLQSYVLYLKECLNAMDDLDHMDELNIASNLKLLLSKVPYKLRERWRTLVFEYEQKKTRVKFKHLVEFLDKQANILLHPIFGDFKDLAPAKGTATSPRMISSKTHKKASATSMASTVSKNYTQPSTLPTCSFCGDPHSLISCSKFALEPHATKVEHLKNRGHCFGCLRQGHMSRSCQKRLECQKCKGRHPTLLHINRTDQQPQQQPPAQFTSSTNTQVSAANHAATGASRNCAMAIVPVQIKGASGSKIIHTYAFLDPGSTASFCTEQLMERLNTRGRSTQITLKTMGQERLVKCYELTGLEVGSLDSNMFIDLPNVYTQKAIPVSKRDLLTQQDLSQWPYLNEVTLRNIDADIELLIGINVPKAMEPWQIIRSQGNGPYAVKTLFGWVVNGPISSTATEEDGTRITANRISLGGIQQLLISQYNHDFPEKEYDEKKEMSIEDQMFMDIASNSLIRKDGHYYLPLPFRDKDPTFPDNYDMAAQRAWSLAKRMNRDSAYASEYMTFMESVLEKGYAEKVPPSQLQKCDGQVWHIPHHGVYHKQKGKLRVVFDCSASYQGKSLNGMLLQGPDLANPLLGILLRFRHEGIALMADIEAMYYQVKVHQHQRDFMRFLWWPQGDTSQPLEVYRMTVHLFGAVSSPSIANFALKQTAVDNSHQLSVNVQDTIKHSFYVDDCLKSVPTVAEAIQLTSDLRKACAYGGFTLNKWVSNSYQVLETIPENHRAAIVKQLDLDLDKQPLERALGIQWDIRNDKFTFRVAVKNKAPTRRNILSVVSSIYDPLGVLAPFTLQAKQILQKLCQERLGWDDTIPDEITGPWTRWLTELEQLCRFEMDRCMKPENFNVKTAELHHFCDASESGYGTASYVRFISNTNDVHVSFVLGKARVAPLKQLTIPRLELAAATLAVKIDRMLQKELCMELCTSTFWTDSTTVLKYIQNTTKRFRTYVANRVAAIHNLSKIHQWRYVRSEQNPADDASRGLHIMPLLNSNRWLNGPPFLSQMDSEWPDMPKELGHIPSCDPEVKPDVTVNAVNLNEASATTTLIEHYSSWKKLVKATAWLIKLKRLLLKRRKILTRKQDEPKGLTVEDLEEAEKSIIRYEQQRHFDSELRLLRENKPVKSDSPLSRLDPRIEDSILKVGGRIGEAPIPVSIKNPIILPKTSCISTLILRDIHEAIGHSGRNHMLSTLRQKFWLPSANSCARRIVRNCVFCRRMQARPGTQKMAALPRDRVTPSLPPFSHVGIDFFGPMEVKRGRSLVKRWGVIFTCLVCRAIHLEVACSLDTDSCINAIRRFLCRRGSVLTIRTDCGTNFTSAQKELRTALSQLDNEKIGKHLLVNHVKWLFNPPYAAHFGGAWERLIRMVKKVLLSIIHQQTVDDEMLQTALCEVECILNDRPLTTASSDPKDLAPLTPNHLLQLKSESLPPPGLFSKKDSYSRKRWKQVQYLTDLFWRRWTMEYLSLMQQRQKWTHPERNFRVNDIVVLVDPAAPRNSWPLGRVIKILPGPKGLVRSVLVQTKTNILQRPISKLCLLLEGDESP